MNIFRFFTKIISNEPRLKLGRWAITYCPNNIENAVKLTNEDHCGTCGSYKQEDKIKQEIKQKIKQEKKT